MLLAPGGLDPGERAISGSIPMKKRRSVSGLERRRGMTSILWLITILLVVMWVLGYAVNIGAWINFLLIVAVILLIFNVISMLTRRPVD
jgi:Flp pilus assembly protein TadB